MNRYRAGAIKNYFDLLPEKDALRLHSVAPLKTIRENNAPLPQRYTTRPAD